MVSFKKFAFNLSKVGLLGFLLPCFGALDPETREAAVQALVTNSRLTSQLWSTCSSSQVLRQIIACSETEPLPGRREFEGLFEFIVTVFCSIELGKVFQRILRNFSAAPYVRNDPSLGDALALERENVNLVLVQAMMDSTSCVSVVVKSRADRRATPVTIARNLLDALEASKAPAANKLYFVLALVDNEGLERLFSDVTIAGHTLRALIVARLYIALRVVLGVPVIPPMARRPHATPEHTPLSRSHTPPSGSDDGSHIGSPPSSTSSEGAHTPPSSSDYGQPRSVSSSPDIQAKESPARAGGQGVP
jgi:hypothetical protein